MAIFPKVLGLIVIFLSLVSTLEAQRQGATITSSLDKDINVRELPGGIKKPENLVSPTPETKEASLYPDNPLAGLPFVVTPYGFVKADYYWDTRQVRGRREDHALFWPLRRLCDPCGRDINARSKFQFNAIDSRIGFLIKGPNIGRRKEVGVSAIIEADFFGLSEALINQLRMRHAFFRLDFEKYNSHLLFGQFWHPLFQPDCFLRSLSFNLGAPLDTIARQPQIRFAKNFSQGRFTLAVLSQRDFQSFGPFGFTTMYMRNSKTPNICADFRYQTTHDNFFGASVDFKRLAPRIVSSTGYSVKEYVNSGIAQGYASVGVGRFRMNFKGIYAQNATDLVMISGYAVQCVAPITDFRRYVPTACFSVWNDSFYDAHYPCHNFQIEYGLLVGGTKNLGAREALYMDPVTREPIVYSEDPTLAYVWRVAPRILLKRYPLRFGMEFETTGAAFGKIDRFARVYDAVPVHNFRFLFVAYYVF